MRQRRLIFADVPPSTMSTAPRSGDMYSVQPRENGKPARREVLFPVCLSECVVPPPARYLIHGVSYGDNETVL